jgi:hypothetical protein
VAHAIDTNIAVYAFVPDDLVIDDRLTIENPFR